LFFFLNAIIKTAINEERQNCWKAKITPVKPPKEIETQSTPRCAMQVAQAHQPTS